MRSLGLVEIPNLVATLVVADRAAKTAGVRIVQIESTGNAEQCIKLVGSTDDVRVAVEACLAIAAQMGVAATATVLPNPREEIHELNERPAEWSPMLQLFDAITKKADPMDNSEAIGLLETQGLVAALHAADDMLKAAAVKLVGKEKIGAAYVTIVVRGDVASVTAAIDAGKQSISRLGGKLIMADVISRPHAELAALLPK